MKILCLYVRHGTSSYPASLGTLDRWYERHGLSDHRELWIVDNELAPDTSPENIAPRVSVRPGDNGAWEFSAWARALREARSERVDFDIIHCVTSAFDTLYTGYLGHFHPRMLEYAVTRNACLGHLDSLAAPVQLGGTFSDSWVRTCFFFLPCYVAQSLAPWVAIRSTAELFVSPDSRAFRPDAPLPPAYQAHLTAWLEGREIGGHQWHSPVGAHPHETGRFQAKALAIVNEHQLSITLRRTGARLVDFCWLQGQRNTPPAERPDPPLESEQLRVRRSVLGIPEQPG